MPETLAPDVANIKPWSGPRGCHPVIRAGSNRFSRPRAQAKELQ
jgi:hypothetical protein